MMEMMRKVFLETVSRMNLSLLANESDCILLMILPPVPCAGLGNYLSI